MLTEKKENDILSLVISKAQTINSNSQSFTKNEFSVKNICSDFSDNELEEKTSNNPITHRNIEIPYLNTYMNLNLSEINNSKTINVNNSSDNNSSLTSRIRKADFLQIKNTIHLRINFLVNINYFIRNYVYDINQIFNKIDSIIYRKITNLIDKSKYYSKFFKDIINKFENFAFTMEESVTSLNFHFRDDKYNLNKINNEFGKTQKIFSLAILDFYKNLKEKFLLKDSLNEKIKNLHIKIAEISKGNFNILSELIKKKEKFSTKYSSYEKVFENFKKDYNSSEKILNLLNKYDFYSIEIELSKIVNKIFDISEKFFIKYIYCLSQLKNVCRDFISILLGLIEKYRSEITTFFNFSFSNNLTLEKIQMIENDEIVNCFMDSEKDFFYDVNELNDLQNLLKVFQNNIIKFNFIKNEVIYFDENFKIEKFKSFEEIVDFLISVKPEKAKFEASNLNIFCCKLNQIQGFFKTNKICIAMITIQDNIILYDEKYSKKNSQKILMKNSKFNKLEDKISPFKFEISELKVGILYNSIDRYIFDTRNPEDFIELKEIFNNYNNKFYIDE